MLESMIQNPRPTRAEATDVANAVLDGSDAVMLSGETAKGAYPYEAIKMMARICGAAEADVNYTALYQSLRAHLQTPLQVSEAIASAAVKMAWEMQAPCIISLTTSGRMGRALARFRPIPPVLAVTASPTAARQMSLLRGIHALLVHTMQGSHQIIEQTLLIALKEGICVPGDHVVVTSGTVEGSSGSTNVVSVMQVPNVDTIEEIAGFFI